MRVSARLRSRASQPFVTTVYRLLASGVEAHVPKRGPCWKETAVCQIGLHHYRTRKIGVPWKWLAVMRCEVHRRAFTAYPPGHVPFGRVPLVGIAGDETIFLAATDAGRGTRWPRSAAPVGVRSTQRRRIRRAAELLGLLGESGAELAAAVAHLAAGELVETVRRLAESTDLSAWGREVARVVEEARQRSGPALMDRLAVLGHVAGLWGRPYRWLPRPGRLLELGRPFWRSPVGRMHTREPPDAEGDVANEIGPRNPL